MRLQVYAHAPDPYNQPYSFPNSVQYNAVNLLAGLAINPWSGVISGTVDYHAAEAFGGSYATTIIASDSVGGSASTTFSWAVTDTIRPPTLSPLGDQTNVKGDTVSLQVNASQPDGDQIIYDADNLPSGLSIDSSSGLISGTVADDAADSSLVTVTATDQTETASECFVWNVTTTHDPSLTAPSWQTNAAGDMVSLPVTATDMPGNTLTYSATNLPDGLSIDPASGVVSGTIQNDAASGTPSQVTVTASNGFRSDSQTFGWTVNTVGVSSPGDQSNTTGDTVTLPVTATDAADLPLTYSAYGLPSGLSIDSSSGVIAGTLSANSASAYPYQVTVSASDGLHSGSTTFAWDVAAPTLADRSDVEGATVSVPTPPTYGYSTTYAATGLPPGVSIDTSTGLMSGTIQDGDGVAGPYAVEVTATAMGMTVATQDFTWTLTPAVNTTPVLTAPTDQTSVAGTPVSLPVTASNADGEALTYTATNLPDGLSIDPDTGVISGALAEDAIQSAPYVVTLTADDGYGDTDTQTFNWTVQESTLSLQANALSQQEGAGVDTFTVGTFTDPDLNRAASDYTATINWGDGQTSQGSVDGANGSFTISGAHVYLHPGGLPLQVTVTDPTGATATSAAIADVTEAPITASSGLVDGAIAGTSSTLTVATFSDANGYDPTSSYSATIAWGDGSTSTGAIDGDNGVLRVQGAHTYISDAAYTVTTTLSDADQTTATAVSTVQAGDFYADTHMQLTVASFTSPDPNATASNFTATINWGDPGVYYGATTGVVTEVNGAFQRKDMVINNFPILCPSVDLAEPDGRSHGV